MWCLETLSRQRMVLMEDQENIVILVLNGDGEVVPIEEAVL